MSIAREVAAVTRLGIEVNLQQFPLEMCFTQFFISFYKFHSIVHVVAFSCRNCVLCVYIYKCLNSHKHGKSNGDTDFLNCCKNCAKFGDY